MIYIITFPNQQKNLMQQYIIVLITLVVISIHKILVNNLVKYDSS